MSAGTSQPPDNLKGKSDKIYVRTQPNGTHATWVDPIEVVDDVQIRAVTTFETGYYKHLATCKGA